jgi:alkylhydroperoxidase/carboxymuconolactone decarboxylase family protein YurZ
MNNTTPAKPLRRFLLTAGAAIVLAGFHPAFITGASAQAPAPASAAHPLSPKQQAIAPVAAAMAQGDMPRLNAALNQGLDAGLTVSDAKEILVQLYAYAGFPRSLNALGELMKVLELATVGALAAMTGVESQLQSHIGISMNVGLTAVQLRSVADVLGERGQSEAAARVRAALEKRQ